MVSVALRHEQVAIAQALHTRLSQWSAVDAALDALRSAFPDNTAEHTLLKVAAINQLYATNVYAVTRMARHVSDVLAMTDTTRGEPDLVERLAALPPGVGEKPRSFLSFGSKFAHFFIDSERFPIYDSYALSVLRYHLGTKAKPSDHPYRDYVRDLRRLREESGLAVGTRELDRYLWLAGEHRAYLRGRRDINVELRALFAGDSAAVNDELALLAPANQFANLKSQK